MSGGIAFVAVFLTRLPRSDPTPAVYPSPQVSSAALDVLRAAVRSCPRALDPPVLERLMPSVFLRIADPRDTTRVLATSILDGEDGGDHLPA